jgi:hypothetical protein
MFKNMLDVYIVRVFDHRSYGSAYLNSVGASIKNNFFDCGGFPG